MWGSPGVAGHRVISAGTVLVVGAGLALYQMTSLVLGPSGSRQLHLSLTVPAVDTAERAESWTSSGKLVLGILAAPAPAARVPARSSVAHRVASAPAASVAAAPVAPVASPVPVGSPVPVASPRPEPRPSEPPAPIVRGGPGPQPGGHKPDDSD
jgi:hypothetical protein